MADIEEKWDLGRINALIEGGIEERYDLEFKGAKALKPKNKKSKEEIVKDVSAMANSAGGTIIYGIAETTESGGVPYAGKIDPIDREVFSTDTLDQIIQSVQPRINGIRIQAIDMPEPTGRAIYVVTVPQSGTAHQAKDKKYHRRRNTTTDAMDDYEVRDVMNRSKFPKMHVSFTFETFPKTIGLRIHVSNQGGVMARHVRVFISMPMSFGLVVPEREGRPNYDIENHTIEYCWKNLHYDFVGKSIASEATNSGWAGSKTSEDCFVTRDSPILPGTNLNRSYETSLRPENLEGISDQVITWEAYADNAPVESGKLELSEIYKDLKKRYLSKEGKV